MTGAAFTLLDTTGNEAGKGTTNAGGVLAFDDLALGVYRLKETSQAVRCTTPCPTGTSSSPPAPPRR
ncbi:prealbumin-like fold domain-containing protein [Streptomyces niveus]|uniref:prealbumin-like fold domain-containing protein n=1 Tax=Streptomyces niveus TaxID=193462 RepID=UPI0035DBDEBD